MPENGRNRRGFSLIELVVVVMILGVLGAIAAPKLLGTSQQAKDNGLRQTVSVIRTAIDSYAAETGGALPGADGQEVTFKNNLKAYLRGEEFPTCPVGGAKNSQVRMVAGSAPIAGGIAATEATHSWVYQYETGNFYVNSAAM